VRQVSALVCLLIYPLARH